MQTQTKQFTKTNQDLNHVGRKLLEQGNFPEAIACLQKALENDPDNADTSFNLGLALNHLKMTQEALYYFNKTVEIDPAHVNACFKMGIIHKALGNPERAISCYQQALEIQPHSANIHFNMGNAYLEQENYSEAISCYEHVLHISPDDLDAVNNMGIALKKSNNVARAVRCHEKAIKINPQHSDAYCRLGQIYKDEKKFDKAIPYFLKALDLNPNIPKPYIDLGGAFYEQDEPQKAVACCKKALLLDPNNADAHYNLGISLEAQGKIDDALERYNQTLKIDPTYADAMWNRSLTLLLKADFQEGWKGYEQRIRGPEWQNVYPYLHGLPRWDGTPFKGKKLYVHDEQGIGDTLQFIRYLPMVKALGGEVVFETKKTLQDLLKNFPGIDRQVIRSKDGSAEIACDLFVPLMSLAMIFKTTLTTIPDKTPYLAADPVKAAHWKHQVDGSDLKVGLVWAGNPEHKKDHLRSCPLNNFEPLTKIHGISLIGLQKGKAANQTKGLQPHNRIINYGEQLQTFSDTAGLIANLDMVICVDTAVAHLAGAMGKPVWLLLPVAPDWRWLLKRKDSPWYPTMRLFRQHKNNDWESVISRVERELCRLKNENHI